MTIDKPVVVVIEDEAPIRRFLGNALEAEFRVHSAADATEGLRTIARENPELVVLDLGLPDRDGVEVIRELRRTSAVPIVVLSAREQEVAKVAALDAGADDYLVKPFGVAELEARLRVALRHANRIVGRSSDAPYATGDLLIDLERRTVQKGGAPVHLTPNEFKLLAALTRHAGRVMTHRQLLKEVWGPSHVEHAHYLRIYMGQLRHKLEDDPAQPKALLTELGVGYRLAEPG